MKKLFTILFFFSSITSLFAQDGAVDNSFNPTLDLSTTISVVKQQADNKVLIGGFFIPGIQRLNSDGSADTTFNASNILTPVYCLGIQNDNKIIVGGNTTPIVKRLNTDGSIDNSFNCNVTGSTITNLKILNNGKIIICGYFSYINGNPINGIARLNSDGSLDTSFNLNLPNGIILYDFGVQSDDKIIIAGDYDIPFYPYMVHLFRRHNTDNSIDMNFNIGGNGPDGGIADIEILSDNKIMITGGGFLHYNNQGGIELVRLNSDGTLDTGFYSYLDSTPGGGYLAIWDVKGLNDGKYIINGDFVSYNGQSSNKIAKLNHDGTIDTTFQIGTGADNPIYSTDIQNDGKILIGGYFTTFNDISKNSVARLGNTILSTNDYVYENAQIMVYPNPTQDFIYLENNSNSVLTSLKLFNSLGQELKSYQPSEISNNSIDLKEFPNNIYYLQISIDGKTTTKKIIKR